MQRMDIITMQLIIQRTIVMNMSLCELVISITCNGGVQTRKYMYTLASHTHGNHSPHGFLVDDDSVFDGRQDL
jgi:hypothetical protein